MGMPSLIVSVSVVCLVGCASSVEKEEPAEVEQEPTGVIARPGTAPTIDGVIEPGEWDDAAIVRVGDIEQFRIKHDGVNLYFAVRAGGGDIRFHTGTGLRVLHWSAQLGSAEYTGPDPSTLSLVRPFSWALPGLRLESPAVIRETLARYLAENGWASSTGSMGNLMESEMVVSLGWLGVDAGSGRVAEIPSVRVGGGLLVSRDDPRGAELMKLPREELMKRYPPVSWPTASMPDDPISMGQCPDTIRIDPADYGRVWIDLRGVAARQSS